MIYQQTSNCDNIADGSVRRLKITKIYFVGKNVDQLNFLGFTFVKCLSYFSTLVIFQFTVSTDY